MVISITQYACAKTNGFTLTKIHLFLKIKCTVITFYPSQFLIAILVYKCLLLPVWFCIHNFEWHKFIFPCIKGRSLYSGSHGDEIRESCGFAIWGSGSPSKPTSCWQGPFPSHFKLEGPFSCSLPARVPFGPWSLLTVLFSAIFKGCLLSGHFLSIAPVSPFLIFSSNQREELLCV